MSIDDSNKKALIISVSDYEKLDNLEFCKKDGEEVFNLLTSLGYQIENNNKLIGNVEGHKMKDAITDFFINDAIKTSDTLLFYFSGHGVPDVDGSVYLASSEIDPDVPLKRGYSFDELTTIIERSRYECS